MKLLLTLSLIFLGVNTLANECRVKVDSIGSTDKTIVNLTPVGNERLDGCPLTLQGELDTGALVLIRLIIVHKESSGNNGFNCLYDAHLYAPHGVECRR